MSGSTSSSIAAIFGSCPSSCATASVNRTRASLSFSAEHGPDVHGTALPRRAEHPGQRGLQARVSVADRELHADQPSGDQAPEEVSPERLGLRFADVEARDLPAARLVHAVSDHDDLPDHPASIADLPSHRRCTHGYRPSNGRSRNAVTCSSSRPAIRLTSPLNMRSPRLLTS